MPISDDQVQAWKAMIAEDELMDCLDEMMEATAHLPAQLSNEIIGLNARLHRVHRHNRLGVLSADEVMRETARIRLALLELLPSLTEVPAPSGPATHNEGTAGRKDIERPEAVAGQAGRIPVFISWSNADDDRPYKADLDKQLVLLRRMGKISVWDKTQVEAGADPRHAAEKQLAAAEIFLVLLSQDYFFSDDCFDELERIQQQRSNRNARVVPILIRPCQYDLLPIGRLQILPRNKRPISEHDRPDSAWATVVREIHALIEDMGQ